jgi:hypothetical protein
VKDVGFPVHAPSEVVTVWPTTAAPVIAGKAVLLGAAWVLAEPTGESSAAAISTPVSNATYGAWAMRKVPRMCPPSVIGQGQ